MQLKKLIKYDLATYFMQDLSEESFVRTSILFLKAYFDVDFRIVFWYRLYSYLYAGTFKKISILMYFRVKSRYGIDIHPTSVIGGGLRLMHGFDVVIGPNVRIGKGCKIFNGVTLGKARPDNIEILMPEIGNFCILGAGSKILGKLKIKDCSIVGANHVPRRKKDDIDAPDLLIRNVYEDYAKRMMALIKVEGNEN